MAIALERVENFINWDKELELFRGSIFMSSPWISVISNNERKPVCLRFIENAKLVAMLGGIELNVKNSPAKQLFFYSGIASEGNDASLILRCKTALYEYAQKSGYQRVAMRSYDHHSYLKTRTRHFRIRERMEYVFYLDKDRDNIINRFDRDLRRKVRKAKRKGAVLRNSSSPELIDTLFSLCKETYNLRQIKGYGRYEYLYLPFFNRTEILRLVKSGHASFFYVEKDKEILSMQLLVYQGKHAYSTLMGTSAAGYREGAPSLLFYELVMLLKNQDYLYLNIGGVSRSKQQMGLKKFKDTLGAETVKSAEEITNFIAPPLSFLNPFLELKRLLNSLKFIPGRVKLPFLLFIDLIVQRRDRY